MKGLKMKNLIFQGQPDYPSTNDDGGYTPNGDSAT